MLKVSLTDYIQLDYTGVYCIQEHFSLHAGIPEIPTIAVTVIFLA